ncbi:MAG TPA: DUF349 domain-containing protein [Rhizobacter sp.]|nr:DUF349 domain-containing protein [Rhizobacter sp.]
MLSWFSKKRDDAEVPAAPEPAAPAKAKASEDAQALWAPRLQAALGDDAALLLIAKDAPVLQIRLDAIEALVAEDALKQAERELRTQDSRVHRAAKRRHVAAVAQREARAAAQAVIDAAALVLKETPLPANRLVAIDRDWQAIDAAWVEPAQAARFTELREQLNTRLREQGEAEQRQRQEQQRLLAEALQAQAEADAAERERLAALAAAQPPSPPPAPEPLPPAAPKALSAEQKQQLDHLFTQAEAAVAEGQLAAVQQHLQAIDAAIDALHGAPLGDKRRARLHALQAERARLKGWQQWGGARALDSLVDEAEALAQATRAAADPEARAPKLRLKAHAEAIQSLRARWKEIDRTGAPSNQALWHRFDAALHIAHEPVAAQQAVLKAQREENLQARQALLDALDAVPVGETPDWKEPLRALTHFQLAWRQLGPLEHTVPSASRNALQERMRASLARIEEPLDAARRSAEAEREQLIARAEALAQSPARDAVPRVRELQAEWQQHARTLPLARAAEGALWARFKAATDAVFAQREAASSARDAELAANLAAREALITRLSEIDLDATPVADLQRALREAEHAWRTPLEVPRAAVASIDTRFRAAHEAVAQAVAHSAKKRWQAQCDALAAKLALCEESEATPGSDLAERWAAQPTLPVAWEKPLALRWSHAPAPAATAPCDDLLLRLEAAFNLPASAEQQAARRELKLRELKEALEGRAAQTQDPVAQRARWFVELLQHQGLSPVQRERLHALVAALREAPPGTLGGGAR